MSKIINTTLNRTLNTTATTLLNKETNKETTKNVSKDAETDVVGIDATNNVDTTNNTTNKAAPKTLLDFQKELNTEFENKNEGIDFNQLSSQLGMSFVYEDKSLGENIRLFFPLNSLKHIISNVKYEKIHFHQSWLRGFMHFRGENVSVVDVQNLFNPKSFMPQDIESRLIITKDYEQMRYALLGRDISLLNLDKQYHSMDITQQEPEVEISIDKKLLEILKKSNNMDYSVVALNPTDNAHQPSYLSLAHVQRYSRIYTLYFNEVNRFYQHRDYNKKINNFCILVFASSFFIDEAGVLGIVIDMQRFNEYLYNMN